MLLTLHLSSRTDIQMPLTFLYMNEAPAAEEFGIKWGKRQQQAVLSVTAQSWGMQQSLKGFSEHSSFD